MTEIVQKQEKKGLVASFASKYGVDSDKLLVTLKNTCFKTKDPISNEQMMALLVVADQYDLNPFTREIFAYPDKGGIVPVVSVDGWARIINSHPTMDGVEFIYSPEVKDHKGKTVHMWIDCVIYRTDRKVPIKIREYFDEVVRSVSYSTPWDSHPHRMHRHKTLIQCARVAFGFAGIFDEDEAMRIKESKIARDSQTDQQKESKETLAGLNGEKEVIIEAEAEVTFTDNDDIISYTTNDHLENVEKGEA